jgi:hypothetical protein
MWLGSCSQGSASWAYTFHRVPAFKGSRCQCSRRVSAVVIDVVNDENIDDVGDNKNNNFMMIRQSCAYFARSNTY